MVFVLVPLSHIIILYFGLREIKKKISWRFNSSSARFRGSWYRNSFDYVALAFHRIILSSRYLEQDVDLPSVYQRNSFVLRVSLFSVSQRYFRVSKAFVSKFYSRSLVYFFTDLERVRRYILIIYTLIIFIFTYIIWALQKFILT